MTNNILYRCIHTYIHTCLYVYYTYKNKTNRFTYYVETIHFVCTVVWNIRYPFWKTTLDSIRPRIRLDRIVWPIIDLSINTEWSAISVEHPVSRVKAVETRSIGKTMEYERLYWTANFVSFRFVLKHKDYSVRYVFTILWYEKYFLTFINICLFHYLFIFSPFQCYTFTYR